MTVRGGIPVTAEFVTQETRPARPVAVRQARAGRGQIQLWNHMRASQELNGRVCAARTGYR
jgi:hypothetical protein